MAVKYQSVAEFTLAYNDVTVGSRGILESLGLWRGPIPIGSSEATIEKIVRDADSRLPRNFGKGKLLDAEDMESWYGPAKFVLE